MTPSCHSGAVQAADIAPAPEPAQASGLSALQTSYGDDDAGPAAMPHPAMRPSTRAARQAAGTGVSAAPSAVQPVQPAPRSQSLRLPADSAAGHPQQADAQAARAERAQKKSVSFTQPLEAGAPAQPVSSVHQPAAAEQLSAVRPPAAEALAGKRLGPQPAAARLPQRQKQKPGLPTAGEALPLVQKGALFCWCAPGRETSICQALYSIALLQGWPPRLAHLLHHLARQRLVLRLVVRLRTGPVSVCNWPGRPSRGHIAAKGGACAGSEDEAGSDDEADGEGEGDGGSDGEAEADDNLLPESGASSAEHSHALNCSNALPGHMCCLDQWSAGSSVADLATRQGTSSSSAS